MKTTTPSWIEPYITSYATLTLDGEEHTYAIIDRHSLSRKHNVPEVFAICSAEGVIAISDTYPEEYRELGITHEIKEFLDEDKCDHVCVRALQQELQLAKDKGLDMRKYVEFRISFFRQIVWYYERALTETPGMLEKLRLSYSYLLSTNPWE